jgi:DNA-directed RNA polymerase subunit M/transcription elongation factor TFIIS
MNEYRKIARTLVPSDVEEAVYKMNLDKKYYSRYVRNIYTWSKALNITPSVEHVSWDDDMWRFGTDLGKRWEQRRSEMKPKQSTTIVFDKPTLLQCPRCNKNMVHIDKMVQKRGCDEPATIYASCKNPTCKKKLGREYRFRTEG